MKRFKQAYVEAWGVYEAARKLGFDDDSVSFVLGSAVDPSTGATHPNCLQIRIDAGGKEFVAVVGPVAEPYDKAKDIVRKLKTQISNGEIDDNELEEMWRSTRMANLDYFASFSAALLGKGFVLPGLAN